METFPAFIPLRGKRVIIAGDGEPADAKARLFGGSPAIVGRLHGAAALDPGSYCGADLIFVASWDPQFREAAAIAARTAGVPLNVVDAPELSDFHTPAIIDRGQVVAAIGTAGASPLLASLIRSELETLVPEEAGRIASLLGQRRETVRTAFPDLPRRRAFLRKILSGPAAVAASRGDLSSAGELIDRAISTEGESLGRVVFIEAAASPDLISLRAARVLAIADVLYAGAAAEPLLANHGRRDAERPAMVELGVERLQVLASDGRIVAVVGEPPDPQSVDSLRRRGVDVEVLTAPIAW